MLDETRLSDGSPRTLKRVFPTVSWPGMKVSDLGERRVVELILSKMEQMEGSTGFWEDASAIPIGDDRLLVSSVDTLVWSTDVPPGMTARMAGAKAVTMAVSDMAAKGVKPTALMVSMSFPSDWDLETVLELSEGVNQAARGYGAYVVGGDTNECPDPSVTCVALGVCPRSVFIPRSGARPGDLLATTGLFGDTAAGLKVLLEGFEAPESLREKLLKAVYHPKARLREGVKLAETGAASASIDSSDGLAMSLHDLSRSSGVGFLVESLPASESAEEFASIHGLKVSDLVLYGGEEFEIVCCVKPDRVEEAVEALREVGCNLKVIGRVVEQPGVWLLEDGKPKPVPPMGWEHFRR